MGAVTTIWILWMVSIVGPVKALGEFASLNGEMGCLSAAAIHEISSPNYNMFVCQELPLLSWFSARRQYLYAEEKENLTGFEREKLRLEIELLKKLLDEHRGTGQ